MARDLVDIWQDDYDNKVEGRGIYRDYVEPEYDPDAEPNHERMNAALANLELTLEELNQQEEIKQQRMKELDNALRYVHRLARRLNNG